MTEKKQNQSGGSNKREQGLSQDSKISQMVKNGMSSPLLKYKEVFGGHVSRKKTVPSRSDEDSSS